MAASLYRPTLGIKSAVRIPRVKENWQTLLPAELLTVAVVANASNSLAIYGDKHRQKLWEIGQRGQLGSIM